MHVSYYAVQKPILVRYATVRTCRGVAHFLGLLVYDTTILVAFHIYIRIEKE